MCGEGEGGGQRTDWARHANQYTQPAGAAKPGQARASSAPLGWVGLVGAGRGNGWVHQGGGAEVLLPGKRCHNPTQHTQDINTQIWDCLVDFKEPEKGRWID